MSSPASDPPIPPSDAPNGNKDGESSTSRNEPALASDPVAPIEDVKMEEVKAVEDTFEDIPDSVIRVRISYQDGGRSMLMEEQSDPQEIKMQTRMIDNEIRMMRQENLRLAHERETMVEKIADNTTKIKQNKVLPYLVSKIVEVSSSNLPLRDWSLMGGIDIGCG